MDLLQSKRFLAIAEGVLVTIIWASSFVFIKIGIAHLKPFTLAGMRYSIAFILLLPSMIHHRRGKETLVGGQWVYLFIMGLFAYTIGNGTLFWGLKYLPAITGSFLHSLTPLPVLFLGILLLKEMPKWWQVVGVLITLGGSVVFFLSGLSFSEPLAVGVVLLGVLAFGFFGIFSRKIAKQRRVGIIPMTAIPLGFGGGSLLILGLLTEGMFHLSLIGWAIVLWLVVINTIFPYLLFYHSLQVLTALELHIILNFSPLGTALLANFLLGECLDTIQMIGVGVVIFGISIAQWRREGKDTNNLGEK